MAIYSFHANFETGSKDAFDSESDTGNRLDFPGPEQLQHDMLAVFPHKGGYCARVNLGKNSTDAYVSKTVSWALDATNYMRFELLVGEDVQSGNLSGDVVDIVSLQSGSGEEGVISLTRIEPAGLVIGARNSAGAFQGYVPVVPGDWVCIEAQIDVDAGAGNDGSIIMWIGDSLVNVIGLDQAAITSVRFGAMTQTGDWNGHIYFDEVIFNTSRLYPDYGPHNLKLDGETLYFAKSGFAFIGQGHIVGCQLIDGGSGDCALKVYDTDDVNYAEAMKKEHLTTTAANAVAYSQALGAGMYLFKVDRGCYVALSGTSPQALIRMGMVDELALADMAEEMEMQAEEEPQQVAAE